MMGVMGDGGGSLATGGGSRSGKILRWGLMAAGLAAIAVASTRVPWPDVRAALAGARPLYLVGSAGVAVLAVGARSLRLALLSGDASRHFGAWRAYALGYLASIVLPLGSGELVKVAAFQRVTGLGWARSGASVLLDRLMDLSGMAAVLGFMLAGGWLGGFRTGPVVAILGALALVLAGLGLVILRGDGPRRLLERLEAGGGRPWAAWLRRRYAQAHDQALLLRAPGLAVRILLLQLLVLALDTTGAWLSLQAFPFGTGVDFLVPLRLNLYLMFAAALPLLPGSIGTYQVACLLALRPLGVPLPQALAFALVAQATTLLFLLGQGLVALIHAPTRIFSVPVHDAAPEDAAD